MGIIQNSAREAWEDGLERQGVGACCAEKRSLNAAVFCHFPTCDDMQLV